ncbi:TniB family NTP-binding protein [Methyloversatilis sp.]|uniref:TniB family NTP-binding protein n=1 Tax=Methyloversatilis sp. TaxID=2569862 RepID=UPI002736F28B|nr:TniB family NTP-binding protein [Methyloversatilis sp.]MDP3456641.1 TniB family NTP-binding protein [Methyloversatilis sp.]
MKMEELPSGLNAFRDVFYQHDKVLECISAFNDVLRYNDGRREPSSLAISGRAGTGKTTLCSHLLAPFKAEVFEEPEGIRKVIPAFYQAVPGVATIKDLAQKLLIRLEVSDLSGNRTQLTERLIQNLKTCKTRFYILDEFQHLVDPRKEKTHATVRNWVKDLMNESMVPIILVGTADLLTLLEGDEQLERRFRRSCSLSEFALNDDFRKVIIFFTKRLNEHCSLKAADVIKKSLFTEQMYAATGGNMSATKDLFVESADQALTKGDTELSDAHFREAYRRIRISSALAPEGVNPFSQDADRLGLSRTVR